MNENEVRVVLRKGLKTDYYSCHREWPYKNVPHRILAEELLRPSPGCRDLLDYKFYCFNGTVQFFKIDSDRFTNHHATYFTPEGKFLNLVEIKYPPDPRYKEFIFPDNLDSMVDMAERISKGIPFVRVDFYNVSGRIYFGEITFFPKAGLRLFSSSEVNKKLGECLRLPN